MLVVEMVMWKVILSNREEERQISGFYVRTSITQCLYDKTFKSILFLRNTMISDRKGEEATWGTWVISLDSWKRFTVWWLIICSVFSWNNDNTGSTKETWWKFSSRNWTEQQSKIFCINAHLLIFQKVSNIVFFTISDTSKCYTWNWLNYLLRRYTFH